MNEGKLLGPRDLFDDPAFDLAREEATKTANYLQRHVPFEPHRLGLDDMEYTTMPRLMEKLAGRWAEEAQSRSRTRIRARARGAVPEKMPWM